MEWNEEKAEEIVKKHKSRFSLRLTLKILRVLFAIFILYTIYMIVISIAYDASSLGKRTEFYQKLAIDWTYPELTTEVGVSHQNEITPFLTQVIDIPLMRRVGRDDYLVSELHLRKPLLNMFTQTRIEENYPYAYNNEQFRFNLPYDPETNEKMSLYKETNAWNTLKKIHEGHVADLAFSLDDYYSPEDIIDLLSSYDLEVTWIPIYMGELVYYEEAGWSGSSDSISLMNPWGLSGAREASDNYMSGSLINLSAETIKESENVMLENMNMMLNKKKSLAETLLKTKHLQERYDYLNEHGFKAYGALVTGPVKELLKLEELDDIHNVILGDIEYWNWND